MIKDKSGIGVQGGKYNRLIFLDKSPSFKSESSIFKFISSNFKNPNDSRAEKITGRVFVFAYVNANGILTDLKVARGIDRLIDEEALRILKLTKVENGNKESLKKKKLFQRLQFRL